MRSLINALNQMLQGIYKAIARFPLAVACLFGSTALSCYMISLRTSPELITQKLMFTLLLGSFLGVTAQFACERFPRLAKNRLGTYLVAILLTGGYYLLIASAPTIDFEVVVRTLVAMFALFCTFIWLPSYKDQFNFNSVALIHFKSAFTSVLYALVLSAGLGALLGAIDLLLFNLASETYGYMLSIVWIFFATTYYLARLPHFQPETTADSDFLTEADQYPRILEILVSQIAIPLVAAFTVVLFSYFIKIAVTSKWPIGQLGPMILGYSASGLLVYVLASRLSNRFAVLYQRIFPKLLVPIVIMQLVSVYIRLRAYGVTESRYYVTLFAIFSLVVGLIVSWRPVSRNGLIALLAAGFAIFSVIPPVDAFTVSRNSQIARLEHILQGADILVAGELQPRADADLNVRIETTNILDYLNQRGYLERITWLPADFIPVNNMQAAFGFRPTYPYMRDDVQYFQAHLEHQRHLPISGYDLLLQTSIYRRGESFSQDLTIKGTNYRLLVERLANKDVRVVLKDTQGLELVAADLQTFTKQLIASNSYGGALPVETLTFDTTQGEYSLRIVFQHIYSVLGDDADSGADYELYIMIGVPPAA